MRVHKDTDFELSMMPWEVEPPRPALMVVVKATFAWGEDGAPCTIAAEQIPCLGEVPWDDGDPPSLKTETDYAVLKPRGEWYLVGTAHAPGGRPATLVPVGARVGDMHKQLVVYGDRVWRRGVLGAKPSDPAPFTSMPLRWERSFGGPRNSSNPVGRGVAPVQTEQGPVDALPNIEDPRRPVLSRDDSPPPAGMFPIPSTWRARLSKTGTYDDAWKSSRWPFFPKDFQFSFFNAAPADQQREGYWRGDEEIELQGLHPERTRLQTRLPGLRARVFLEWATPRPPDATPLEMLSRAELEALGPPRLQDVPLRLDTIVIDADAGHVLCSWRGLVDVADNQLSNVARIFVVHEPIGADEPLAHYERWLLRKLCEEADDLLGDDADDLGAGDGDAALAGASIEAVAPELSSAGFQRDLLAFLESLEPLAPDAAPPEVAQVRESYRELGLDPDPLLQEAEVPVTPEVVEPASLLRFEAIVRRRNGKSFAGLDLSDAPYRGLDLGGVDFTGAILTGANLADAILVEACFDEATLTRADLSRANARKATFRGADLSELRAPEARFDQAVLDDAAGTGAVLVGARFRGASFLRAELEACDLTRADMRDATLDGADLVGSFADEADFMNSSLVDTSLESVRARHATFERCKMADLRASDGADLTGAKLVLVDAPRAQLQGATLVDANLSGSNFEGADLSEARAERVNLVRAVLRGACLDRADLREAVLLSVDFFEASFQEADLTDADARGASFFSADLWRARTSGTRLDAAVMDRTLLGSS